MTDWSKLFEGIASLLWPLIIILLIFFFKPAVCAIIESAKSRKFTLKIGGQELTMEEANQQQRNLMTDLQAQILELQKKVGGEAQLVTAQRSSTVNNRSTQNRTILWVDDQPKNNSFFVQQLSDIGYSVDLALSTSEGLRRFSKGNYGIIISDMGRLEEDTFKPVAGLDLLKIIRNQNKDIPFIIFSSSSSAREHRSEAATLGVNAITSSPTELLGTIQKLLGLTPLP